MAEPLAENIIRKIDDVAGLYYRLVLVVAPSGGGKTTALLDVAKATGFRYINGVRVTF